MNIIQKYRGVILFASSIAILACFIYLGLKPLLSYSYSQYVNKKETSNQLIGLESKIGIADSLLHYNYTIWDKIQAVKSSVPSTGKASFILDKLLENARGEKLKISDMTSLSEVEYKNFIEYPFEIKMEGYFPHLYKYLAGLEGMDMVVNLRNISIQSIQLHKSQIIADVQLSVYILKKNENPSIYSPLKNEKNLSLDSIATKDKIKSGGQFE